MTKSKGGRPRKKRRPRSKLKTWMDAEGMDAAELAILLSVARSSIYGLRERTLTPGLALAVRIERLTGIPVGYWSK